jgi:hypothetical protein
MLLSSSSSSLARRHVRQAATAACPRSWCRQPLHPNNASWPWRCNIIVPPVLNVQRSKHSATQIKRIFRNHPARLRAEERMGIVHAYLPLHPIQFPRIYEPLLVLPNGWSAPLPAEERPNYPFTVKRTKNKPMDAIGFLPVYTKHRYE